LSRRFVFPCLPLLVLHACGGGGAFDDNADLVPIHRVQSAQSSSPLEGRTVLVAGIVTGDFQANDGDLADLGGFFLQQELPDEDPATSEGIFIEDDGIDGPDVTVGERLLVRGTVAEVGGETRIRAQNIVITGRGDLVATDVELPFAALTRNAQDELIPDLENLEGMLVRFPQSLTVTDIFGLERHGEVTVSAAGRLRIYTNGNRPDAEAYARADRQNRLRRLVLDDGRNGRYATPFLYLFPRGDQANAIRVGDSVTGLVGVLHYGRATGDEGAETWRLMPVRDPAFATTNPQPVLPPPGEKQLRVMGYNADNFFTTLDAGADICGPARDANCRGARSAAEFDRQLAKTVTLIGLSGAHVVGLSEIENNGAVALEALTDALNERGTGAAWRHVDTGNVGSDSIRVAFIYESGRVTAIGQPAILDSSVDPRYLDRRNRPAIAQTFADRRTGGQMTVVVNHLKSKSSSCAADGDPDLDDGQSNCNRTRTAAVAAETDWLATDPTGSHDPDVLVIGDMNAHLREDPLLTFEAAGYANLLLEEHGSDAYSYVFRGQAGSLDHALVSPSLRPQVVRVIEWHVNADEPAAFDYRLPRGRDASLFDGSTPYRASDHDPLIIDLALDGGG